jgi:hypothetical protein
VVTWVFTTPGSTTAMRKAGSSFKIRFSLLSAITIPPATGSEPPERLVPLPRATNGSRSSLQKRTNAMTSSAVWGIATAAGRLWKAVNPSLSYAANCSALVNNRSRGRSEARRESTPSNTTAPYPKAPRNSLKNRSTYIMMLLGDNLSLFRVLPICSIFYVF